MSETATPVTPAHLDYIRARTDAEGPFLEDLRRAAVASGIPSIAIAVEQGSFLATLVRVSRAHDIVEVGTLAGYSALWMARGLPEGGRIVTIEKSPNHAAFAREWAGKSPWADKVKVVEGAGSAVLPTLPSSAFDGVFLDADKAGYAAYVDEAHRLLRPGGWIVVDNAFAFGELFAEAPKDRETPAVKAFNERFAIDRRFSGLIVPMGDGFWMATKVAP